MTRRSDLMCEDLDECTHEPETPIIEGGEIVGWLCRCGVRMVRTVARKKFDIPPATRAWFDARYGKTTGDLWSVYEGDTLLYAGEDRQRAFLLFGEAFHRRKEHVRLFRGTEVYAEGYSLKPEGG